MEVHKPLVNLVDNMVTMGSLYGGDNVMLASQYKKVSAPVYNIIFIHFTTMGQYTVWFDTLASILKICK